MGTVIRNNKNNRTRRPGRTRGTTTQSSTVLRPSPVDFSNDNFQDIIPVELRSNLPSQGQYFRMEEGQSAPQDYSGYDYKIWDATNKIWSPFTGNDRNMTPGYYIRIRKQSPSGTIGTTSSSTSTPTGSYFHFNDKTAPVNTLNNGAYTYKEWQQGTPWGDNFDGLQLLSNIYGDIDTADEFKIIAGLDSGLRNYVNSSYNKKQLFDNDGNWIGDNNDIAGAAALINKYLTTDTQGKEYATKLMRGQATLPMLDKYKAYAATKDWTGQEGQADRDYLNEARNSIDKKYNGANFFKKYAGNKTWGTLANEFAQNDYFRNDYVVDAQHVMDRLNRDAGNGRKLIEIYNDIINNSRGSDGKDLLTPEQRYRIFRDMTRRRFKLNNDFWNRAENGKVNLKGIRDKVYGNEDILFKEGGQIFRMLFV